MKVGNLLDATDREDWRKWLSENHDKESDVWLVYYKKHSGKPRLPYNDAVEEALCFGWIDSNVVTLDEDRNAQRFTPRQPGSPLSPMNKERARRLIAAGKMTPAGLAAIQGQLDEPFMFPADILAALQEDSATWANFQAFPESYRRIRVGWIDGARKRPAEFEKRLRYLLKMTARNKRFGMVQ